VTVNEWLVRALQLSSSPGLLLRGQAATPHPHPFSPASFATTSATQPPSVLGGAVPSQQSASSKSVTQIPVSIPDAIFEEAERLAKIRGWSRSELYSNAVSAYVNSERFLGVREKLDAVYGQNVDDSAVDPLLAKRMAIGLGPKDSSQGLFTTMCPYVVLAIKQAAAYPKIHMLVTLGIRHPTKPRVIKARQRRRGGFDWCGVERRHFVEGELADRHTRLRLGLGSA
jgi:hypothetical protein